MRTQIDLKRMRYVVEVARAESITTAAETLGLTQPALTRSIAEVESELGTRLFHRQPRGMQLTEAGTRFVARARRILSDMDDLVADLREGPNMLTGRLRLGVAPSAYIYNAIPSLRRLAEIYPGIKLEVVGGAAQSLCPKLLQGELHAIIGSSSYLKRWRELKVRLLHQMHFACIVRKEHPLVSLQSPQETDILEYPIILPASVEPVYSDVAQRYAHHGVHPFQPQYTTDSLELAFGLLESTDAFMPMHHPDPGFGQIGRQFKVFRNLIQIPEHHISIATSALHPPGEALKQLETLLAEQLGAASD